MKMSRADVNRIAGRAEAMRARMTNLRKKAEKVTERAVHTVEVGAGAFAFGVLQGRSQDPEGVRLFGVPIDLLSGITLHAAGFLGLGGKMSSHLHGFGDGALASYLTTMGRGVGRTWAAKSGSGTGVLENQHTMGAIGRGAAAFSDAEVANAVADAVAAG